MPRMTSRPGSGLPLFLLVIGSSGPLLSQGLDNPPPDYRSPTVVAAVASLKADGGKNGIWLGWPPAAGASEYWVERTDNRSGTVETIAKGPSTMFVFEGSDCSPTAHFKDCQYTDRKLTKGEFYSYRVWTGGGQSPVAHARAQCNWGQAESKPRTNPPTLVWGCW
jgi:hypothetical protein